MGKQKVEVGLMMHWKARVDQLSSWLCTDMSLPPWATNQLQGHVEQLAMFSIRDVHVWLGRLSTTKKGLLIGRLCQLQARWHVIALAWVTLRMHKPVFDAVDK